MINRVDPKSVEFLKSSPNISIENTSGKGHYVFIMHCDKEPFSNVDLRLALKYAMDRETMLAQVLQGFGSVGNDFPINAAYDLFPETIEQRPYDPDKAKFHYQKSGHSGTVLLRTSDVAFPGAIDAAVLYQQAAAAAGIQIEVQREPGDGYWSNVWNVQPFSTSYWGGRPTQALMYATAYLSTADWNDTKWKRPEFDALLTKVRAELDTAKRKDMFTEMATMVRDDGGLILPMFNDFIDAISTDVQGFVRDRAGEMSNGYASQRVWLA
jgi:peptide/nickel transport system substrate-binding protein